MRRAAIALAAIGFAGMVALAAWVCFRGDERVRPRAEPAAQKQYSRLIAEGVRYRDYRQFGLDRFTFKSCRVEKRRSGAFTFGAFNVLVVDELTVNLPAGAAGGEGGNDLVPEGFAEAFLRSQGLGAGRFSGLRINGLTVNRCSSNRVERHFSAARAESGTGKGEGLKLSECAVREPDGSTASVREAVLVLKPEPTLVYRLDGVERRVKVLAP